MIEPIESEFAQQILALLEQSGPIYYNNDGIALVKSACEEVWNALSEKEKQELINAAYRAMIAWYGSHD